VKIVIPSGSGQVGQVLAAYFHGAGHTVTQIAAIRTGILRSGDAARNSACATSARNRREILESRIRATQAVGRAITGRHILRPSG
jgi:NAD dependent epimerase/dehydratase family enzyme